MTDFWHKPPTLPDMDHSVCLIAFNGTVFPDFFVWLNATKQFVGQMSITGKDGKRIAHDFIVRGDVVQFWAYKADLSPLPAS